MKIFKINRYISLKLENNKTVIYLNNDKFILCKHLLINVPIDKTPLYDELNSIDEAESLYQSEENLRENDFEIPPITEFWGHCSNLQVWVENNYNTCLLHRNLAFPLLKKLAELGDPLAKKVFKEEIVSRFATGQESVMNYLLEEGYLNYLNKEEFEVLLEDIKERNIDFVIYSEKKIEFVIEGTLDLKNKSIENLDEVIGLNNCKSIQELDLVNNRLTEIPESIGKLVNLQKLYLFGNNLQSLPHSIGNLKSLEVLCLRGNNLKSLPDSIGNLDSLERLDLNINMLESLPETIGSLKSLRELHLDDNLLKELPISLGELKELEVLNLRNNQLSSLPNSIGYLKSLKQLDLSVNKLEALPETIVNLSLLKDLFIEQNNIKKIPEIISKSLRLLNVYS